MTIKPIRNDDDWKAVFRRLESIFQAEEQTPAADERGVVVTLVEATTVRLNMARRVEDQALTRVSGRFCLVPI